MVRIEVADRLPKSMAFAIDNDAGSCCTEIPAAIVSLLKRTDIDLAHHAKQRHSDMQIKLTTENWIIIVESTCTFGKGAMAAIVVSQWPRAGAATLDEIGDPAYGGAGAAESATAGSNGRPYPRSVEPVVTPRTVSKLVRCNAARLSAMALLKRSSTSPKAASSSSSTAPSS